MRIDSDSPRKLQIAVGSGVVDFSLLHPNGKISALPAYDPSQPRMLQMDLRSGDLSGLDVRDHLNDLSNASFDSKTQWPDVLPDGFDPGEIMEMGRDPGLNVRALHARGLTGKGVGVAVLDLRLMVEHVEYADRLLAYEECAAVKEFIPTDWGTMHGPAAASVAVGKTVGVAPEADLYYFTLETLADGIARVIAINHHLPPSRKIRVISISQDIRKYAKEPERALAAIDQARSEGIYTIYVDSEKFAIGGLGRNPLKNPNDFKSYSQRLLNFQPDSPDCLMLPVDSRCVASPGGVNDYVFYREGGLSWAIPYVAGLFAVACQANHAVTPELFWQTAFATSREQALKPNEPGTTARIVNPPSLIGHLTK